MARPARHDVMVQRELCQMAFALHLVHRLVQTAIGRHIQRRLRVRIQHGTAVERRVIITKLVPEHGLRVLAVPGHRRRNQQILALAKIAPVVFVHIIRHEAPGKPRIGNRAGGVEGHATARAAMGVGGGRQPQRRTGLELRLLADHVDHTTRIHDAVEHRRRPLQHHHALGSGVHAPPLHQRHAVVHDGTIAVAAEAPLHDGVLRAGQRVALGDAAHIEERIVHVAGTLVAQHLGRHRIGHLRGFEYRRQ